MMPGTLGAQTVAHAYGYDQLWAQGRRGEQMTIHLVEVDSFDGMDTQNYFNCVGFTGVLLSPTVVDSAPQVNAGESTLDIEMVAGLAPASTIHVYETSGSKQGIWTRINDELQQILSVVESSPGQGNIVSISLGGAEGEISQSDLASIDQSLQLLVQQHVLVFVGSGDRGAFTNSTSVSPSV